MKNIHLLPTDKPSRLWINNLLQGKLELSKEVLIGSNTVQHIYITSDKEIKERDWYLVVGGIGLAINTYYKSYGVTPKNDWLKKIILTTDQDLIADGVQAIDDEFLEWFVKNPSCENVEVQKWASLAECGYSYHITIPQEEPKHPKVLSENGNELFFDEQGNLIKEEPKQETLEEAADIERIAMDKLKNKWGHLYTFGYPKRPFPTNYENDLNNIKIGLYEGTKWQQERMYYSEEEVLELLIKSHFVEQNIEEWFEQHKKK
jgi:hypothetical protein